ncbi:MAG: HAMP domain-containing protein [Actinobacteria bacterium]|nr:HAMP domain-containing protein [Actinomycetota bacterium]
MPLAWRIFIVNAAVFAAGTVALAVSPATVSSPIALTESLVLAAGLVAILVLNLVLVRRSLAPLERLTEVMHDVDLVRPSGRVEIAGPVEVRELGAVFNEMLDRLEAERRQSGRDALRAQESERQHIARELHDEVGQAMTALMLELGRLAKLAPPGMEEELRGAQEATRATLEDVRRIARHLRPEALDDLGLAPALAALTTAFAERTGVAVSRRIDPDLPRLTPDAELVLFRIAQEALTNVARHASTPRVDLAVGRSERGVRLLVRDYGRGLNGATAGSGIRGMRERALLIEAVLAIASPADGGVEVRLEIPREEFL